MKLRSCLIVPFVIALLLGGAALWFSGVGRHPPGPPPYDETADATQDLRQAMAAAQAANRPVLVIFGANWCEDCRALDKALKSPRNAELMAREFVIVKVDVGNFDRNLDLTARYDNPIRKGIPAAVVLSPDDQVLYATRAGELSSARRMGETKIFEFFRDAAGAGAGKVRT